MEIDVSNICPHCGTDLSEGQHGLIGPADRESAVILTCAFPLDSAKPRLVEFERPADPKLAAIIKQVCDQPERKMTGDEIRAWAQRLASDVADLTD
jgi:hypothetical protein